MRGPWPLSTPWRLAAYAVLLACLSGWIGYHRLGEGTLFGDEASFATSTDRMLATGDWVVPYFMEAPHLNATPLYNWLTLAVRPFFDDTPLWHRSWSALFGVGCVLAALGLGAILFSAEAGLLAGLLLALNRDFQFNHGVRFAGMDAMLAFFLTAAVACYAWLRTRADRWPAWLLLGACVGFAWMSKPPVFGGFFLVAIVAHHLWVRRADPWRARLAGPGLALAAGLLVAGPWYALIWARLGHGALYGLFVVNSVVRAADPTNRDFLCCANALAHSSNAFKLALAAFACGIACALLGHKRDRWSVPAWIAGTFLLALTTSGKCGQYAYYAFPTVAVLLAAAILEGVPHLAARRWPDLARAGAWAGAGLAVLLVGLDLIKTVHPFGAPAWVHPPVGLYARLAPEIEQGRCRLVLVDFPGADGADSAGPGGCNFEELYYLRRMPLADRVRDGAGLERLLADGKPAFVLLPPLTRPQPALAAPPEARVAENGWRFYTYPALAYNGAGRMLPTEELARLARAGQDRKQ